MTPWLDYFLMLGIGAGAAFLAAIALLLIHHGQQRPLARHGFDIVREDRHGRE